MQYKKRRFHLQSEKPKPGTAPLARCRAAVFKPLKELSKFFIVMAMAAIGLNSNLIKLVKNGGKPLLLGLCCWLGITAVSLLMQHVMGLW